MATHKNKKKTGNMTYYIFSDTFSVSPVRKGINQKEEAPTMDINDLFDGTPLRYRFGDNYEKYQPVCR